ncbi:hypothetical protein [Arsenicibacter rosenii]|uniref:ParB/Sulfiredoxin domain-containing protein n=1 Tax=Arsenicibacter rosenii TaxID=1750698 RepID=A0A1S2VBA9_9BACT|nr:hypothetical protein [Arsenicibacter rosenii]OIN55595.1 hypothetical protein BLX24_29265 [Arsenicibacter rosenii]
MKKTLSQFAQKPLIRKETGSLVQQESIKEQITVIPELEALIPPLTTEEYQQLEANIIREGCREPLLIWHTSQTVLDDNAQDTPLYVLIDGHNRYGICKRNGLDFKLALREFTDKEAVRTFMIDNQLGRRNLTPEQMAYLRGQKYLSLKRNPGRPNQEAGAFPDTETLKMRTEEVLAAQFNVSPKTIRLDAQYAKGLDRLADPLKKEVLARKVKVRKSDLMTLADTPPSGTPIQSATELKQVLATDVVSIAAMETTDSSPADSQISQQIDQIVDMANLLKNTSIPLKETCQTLIIRLQALMVLQENRQ